MNSDKPVVVVGAGLAGLCCARRLGQDGVRTVVLDASDAVGGRVRTDRHADGFLLDRGFQVFLDSYPEAAAVLDYDALQLRRFEPGALTRREKTGWLPLGDPFRRPSRALATALSPAATLKDKWLIARLRFEVTRGDAEALLLEDQPRSMLDYLRDYGFGERVIETFFRPFFGGVFLDRSLSTSARLFRWLFRLFARGNACLPAAGMGAIPRQIAARLRDADLRLDTPVAHVDAKAVTLTGGETLDASAVVVAADPPSAATLLGDRLDVPPKPMRQTATLYFAADAPAVRDNLLLLSGESGRRAGPVNTVAQLTACAPTYAPDGQTLLSVSVVDVPDGDDAELLEQAKAGLSYLLGPDYTSALRHLRTYRINNALPSQPPPELADPHKAATCGGVFVCGDWRDTASINGAMLSGRRAAEAVLASRG